MIDDWLTEKAKTYSNQFALEFQNQNYSFSQTNQKVQQFANYLFSLGIKKDVRVAILAQNSADYIFLVQTIARIKAVVVLLNTRLSDTELLSQILITKADWLIYDQQNFVTALQINKNVNINILQIEHINQYSSSATLINQAFSFDLSATQVILFSSGTTGIPKLIALSFANHFYSAIAVAERLKTQISDRSLVCLPLFHIGGLAMLWRSLICGTGLILLPKFDLDLIHQTITKINQISLVPTMLDRLINDSNFNLSDWQKLNHILLGGEAISSKLIQVCLQLKLPVAPTYGMTEAASQIATLKPQEFKLKPNSVGKPLSCNAVKIMAADFTELDVDEIGEIVVKGQNIASEDWFYTGDLGYFDSDRYLYVLQRRTDLIISGGENIYPSQIEQILISHPAIKEVCIVAQPDQIWGQSVAAVVVSDYHFSLQELQAFCLAEGLAKFKLPKFLYQVAELPKTTSGKVKRHLVQEIILTEA